MRQPECHEGRANRRKAGADEMIRVTAGGVRKGDRILIARRGGDDPLAGKWEFPGGKVEDNEDPESGLKRELREELGIRVRVTRFIAEYPFSYPEKDILLLFFEAEYLGGHIALHAHEEFAWVSAAELTRYDFAPADVEFARSLSAAQPLSSDPLRPAIQKVGRPRRPCVAGE